MEYRAKFVAFTLCYKDELRVINIILDMLIIKMCFVLDMIIHKVSKPSIWLFFLWINFYWNHLVKENPQISTAKVWLINEKATYDDLYFLILREKATYDDLLSITSLTIHPFCFVFPNLW